MSRLAGGQGDCRRAELSPPALVHVGITINTVFHKHDEVSCGTSCDSYNCTDQMLLDRVAGSMCCCDVVYQL